MTAADRAWANLGDYSRVGSLLVQDSLIADGVSMSVGVITATGLHISDTAPAQVTVVMTETNAAATASNDHRAMDVQAHGNVDAANQNSFCYYALNTERGTVAHHLASQTGVYGEADGDATVDFSNGIAGYASGAVANVGCVGDHDGVGFGGAFRDSVAVFNSYPLTPANLNNAGVFISSPAVGRGKVAINGVGAAGTAVMSFQVGGADVAIITVGAGVPNGVVAAPLGSLYLNASGGAGATLWVKEGGAATNLGWVAK